MLWVFVWIRRLRARLRDWVTQLSWCRMLIQRMINLMQERGPRFRGSCIMRLCRIYRALALKIAAVRADETSISLGFITLGSAHFFSKNNTTRYTFSFKSFIIFWVGFMYQDVLRFFGFNGDWIQKNGFQKDSISTKAIKLDSVAFISKRSRGGLFSCVIRHKERWRRLLCSINFLVIFIAIKLNHFGSGSDGFGAGGKRLLIKGLE